jgi:beta-xylosidase
MIEAVMLWNEPNNLSHWDFEIDKDWLRFAELVKLSAQAIRAESLEVLTVLGGISPIDAGFIRRLDEAGAIQPLDVVAVHGFPLDWNHWQIQEWPSKLQEIRDVATKPVWVTEVGASSFGAEEVQAFGLQKTAELLIPRLDHIYWYSLFDLPKAWPATTRHRESEGSSYYRHFYMGLYREDGQPKLAAHAFPQFSPNLGICQWFHFEDHRLERGVQLLKDMGVRKLRTGLSWADFKRPNALQWFDKQMKLLEPFDVTITYCFTPEEKGIRPHHTSPPTHAAEFADFCAEMTRRYV